MRYERIPRVLLTLLGLGAGVFAGSGTVLADDPPPASWSIGRLPTYDNSVVYDSQISIWMDQYFEDGAKLDGVVKSNIIYIETQCFPGAKDNTDPTTANLPANWWFILQLDPVRFTNTTYISATSFDRPAEWRGYSVAVAKALKPNGGNNGFVRVCDVHWTGVRNKGTIDDPQIQGNQGRWIGGRTSTHILIWGGVWDNEQQKKQIQLEIESIAQNFKGSSNVTIDVLAHDGKTHFQDVPPPSTMAATKENLENRLKKIGALMDDGEDEQFIFFVTDHGSKPYCSSTPISTCPVNRTAAVPVETGRGALKHAADDPNNQPRVTFVTGRDLFGIDPSGWEFGFDISDEYFLGNHRDATVGTMTDSEGGIYHTYSFDVAESFLSLPANGSGDHDPVIQTVGIFNGSSSEVVFEGVILDLGDLAKRAADPRGLAFPAVARAAGVGTQFISRWDLANIGSSDLVLEMLYTPRLDIGGDPVAANFTLPAGTMIEIDDPIGEIFDIQRNPAVGSVLVQVNEGLLGDLLMQGVITALKDDGSEFGQYFPATPVAPGVAAGETVHFNTTENPANNRVNLCVMALEDGTTLSLTPVAPLGTPIATGHDLALERGQSSQLNNLDRVFSLGGRADYLIEMKVETGSALGYGSVLDGADGQGSSDPTTILPVGNGSPHVTLLELGSIEGLNSFSGSASISNLSPVAAEIQIDFHQRNLPGVAASQTLVLSPGQTRGFGDLVDQLFGIRNVVGTIVLSSQNATNISAIGREFAILFDEEGQRWGTAGQLMAGLNDDDLLTPEVIWHLIGLHQRQTEAGVERSHLALFNPGGEPVTANISLFDGPTGVEEGNIEKVVEPGCLVQINNLIRVISGQGSTSVKRIQLMVSGPVHAKAFRVNGSGDPITIDPL